MNKPTGVWEELPEGFLAAEEDRDFILGLAFSAAMRMRCSERKLARALGQHGDYFSLLEADKIRPTQTLVNLLQVFHSRPKYARDRYITRKIAPFTVHVQACPVMWAT